MSAVDGLAGFLERRGDRAAEVVWEAALVMVARAAEEAREGHWGRWRHYPSGELRRLRRDLAEALELARLAVALREEEHNRSAELDAELATQAAEAARRRRREQTLPAERARLANLARRRSSEQGSGEVGSAA